MMDQYLPILRDPKHKGRLFVEGEVLTSRAAADEAVEDWQQMDFPVDALLKRVDGEERERMVEKVALAICRGIHPLPGTPSYLWLRIQAENAIKALEGLGHIWREVPIIEKTSDEIMEESLRDENAEHSTHNRVSTGCKRRMG